MFKNGGLLLGQPLQPVNQQLAILAHVQRQAAFVG